MAQFNRRVLVTGSNGFVGKNLLVRMAELKHLDVLTFIRSDDADKIPNLISQVDAVVHLAGENRPDDESLFDKVNAGLTQKICDAIQNEQLTTGRKIQLILASSTQAERDNPYGKSKRNAECIATELSKSIDASVVIFRFPGIFGKWCRPNYNSVVATFCYNISRKIPIEISDPAARIKLIYIDNAVDEIIRHINSPQDGVVIGSVSPQFEVSLEELAKSIESFESYRTNLTVGTVGVDFIRALYATYVSYLPSESFSYEVPRYADPRGVFVEMLKTPESGQFSYFTAHPGVTRGGHYHHTKTEKFLVIKGNALFRFRNLMTNELVEISTSGDFPTIVDTIPGWSHDITNIGSEEMIVMLWANEIFDRDQPDTVASKV